MSSTRKIIHIDMDCFYAAIEVRDNPRLRHRPVAVGGRPDKRGVISTCNYEARYYGVHSAMPSSQALRLCPDLELIPPRMEKYVAESHKIRDIFRRYTDVIEPLSLDEAYLDVSGSALFRGSATLIAEDIRHTIAQQLLLTASAGIAPNKFLAKIASEWRKPNGQFTVRPDEVDAFVLALPVQKLHGVGKVTATKLHELGIQTCADLRIWSLGDLLARFGSFGQQLYQLCRGIDERDVVVERVRKSLSVETTFDKDLPSVEACLAALPALHDELLGRFERGERERPVHKLYVKLKFSDFSQTTMETSARGPDLERAIQLVMEAYTRRDLPVRLLGLGLRFRDEGDASRQMELPLTLPPDH